MFLCDYLIERIRIETRKKTILQCGYLLVKGIVKSKNGDNKLFNTLDELFDIPKEKEKPQIDKDKLIEDFENYINGR